MGYINKSKRERYRDTERQRESERDTERESERESERELKNGNYLNLIRYFKRINFLSSPFNENSRFSTQLLG